MDPGTASESIALSFAEPATGDSFVLTYDPLDTTAIIESVRDNGAGALALFVGTTRDNFNGTIHEQLLDVWHNEKCCFCLFTRQAGGSA